MSSRRRPTSDPTRRSPSRFAAKAVRAHVDRRQPMSVWYTKPDPAGFYLIVRSLEGRDRFRVELERDPSSYVPLATATVAGDQVSDIVVPEFLRRNGYAKRLVLLAKATMFPDLYLSGPATWRGRELYRAVVAIHPDMVDETFERDRDRLDEGLDAEKAYEEGFVPASWICRVSESVVNARAYRRAALGSVDIEPSSPEAKPEGGS